MNATDLAMSLLREGVPLTLLLDLAGLPISSEELLAEEPLFPARRLALGS